MNENVDHVFNTVIPPGLQAFTKQLYEAGFRDKGGTISCVYFDENSVNYVPERELEGVYTCLDFLHTVEDPASQQLLAEYSEMFPNTKYLFTAGSASTGMYRGIKLYEKAVIATKGDLSRDAVSAALDSASIDQGPGGPAKMIPGTGHCAMNMYIGQAKGGKFEIIASHEMVDPKECA